MSIKSMETPDDEPCVYGDTVFGPDEDGFDYINSDIGQSLLDTAAVIFRGELITGLCDGGLGHLVEQFCRNAEEHSGSVYNPALIQQMIVERAEEIDSEELAGMVEAYRQSLEPVYPAEAPN